MFLLFCLVIIYLGPFFGRAVDKSPNKLVWLVGGGFLCIGGIIALLLLDGLAAAFACVALLALCNAIVASAQGTYALEIPVSRQVGSGRTVGIYNITERLGQMLGPVALGQVIALWGVNSGTARDGGGPRRPEHPFRPDRALGQGWRMTDCRPPLEGTSFRFLHSRHIFSAKRLLRSSSVRRSMAFHAGGFLSGPLFALFLARDNDAQ